MGRYGSYQKTQRRKGSFRASKEVQGVFPQYSGYKAIGAVAGIVITVGAGRYAYKKGLFVSVQSGESVKILNDKQFKPKYW